MRLWHFKLIPVLPNDMLISQWRECIAIKRQWEKGTLKHRLVTYVKRYNKEYFLSYVYSVTNEMLNRKIKFGKKFIIEMQEFCKATHVGNLHYKEHNDKYLKQCYYNLQEKYDRGIITKDEWLEIESEVIL